MMGLASVVRLIGFCKGGRGRLRNGGGGKR